jgi:hypothetical protein
VSYPLLALRDEDPTVVWHTHHTRHRAGEDESIAIAATAIECIGATG